MTMIARMVTLCLVLPAALESAATNGMSRTVSRFSGR